MTLFKKDNTIKVNYGQWNFLRSSGSRHKGADISTKTAPYHILRIFGGCVEFAGYVAKGSDPTWEWGYHERTYVNQKDAVRRVGTMRATYAHCEPGSLTGKRGQIVQAGTVLGVMGNSGNANLDSQGKHVHFQLDRWNGSTWMNLDPTPYIGGTNTAGYVWYGDKKEDETMPIATWPIRVKVGTVTVETATALLEFLKGLGISAHTQTGYLITDIEISAGDQVKLIDKAVALGCDKYGPAVEGGDCTELEAELSECRRENGNLTAQLAATNEALGGEKEARQAAERAAQDAQAAAAAASARADKAEAVIAGGKKVVLLEVDS